MNQKVPQVPSEIGKLKNGKNSSGAKATMEISQPQIKIKSKKKYGFWTMISQGLGGTVGGPIFVILGTMILRAKAGILISLLINSFLMLAFVLNYSELALSLPISGGGYSFSKEAIGGIQGFLIGWLMWVGNLLFAALSALGFAFSLAIFLPEGLLTPWAYKIISIVIILVYYGYTLWSSTSLNKFMRVLTLILVFGFTVYIIVTLFAGNSLNTDFSTDILNGGYELSSVLSMTAFTFVIYCVYEWNSTFESLTASFDRIERPRKNIPRVFILVLCVGIIIYFLVTLSSLINIGHVGSNTWNAVTSSDVPMATLFNIVLHNPIGLYFMGIIGMVATMTSISSGLQMSTHVLASMSRDGFIHPIVEKKYRGVNWVALTISTVLILCIIPILDVNMLAEISNFIFLVSMFFLSVSVIILRRTRSNLIRPWKVPGYPVTPIIGISASIILLFAMIFAKEGLWAIFAGILIVIVGTIYYLFLIAQRTRLRLLVYGSKIGITFFYIVSTILLGARIYWKDSSQFNWNIIIISIIGFSVITLFLDVIPIRRGISMFNKNRDDNVVVAGLSQLSEKQEKTARLVNRIYCYLLIVIGLLFLLFGIFILSGLFTVTFQVFISSDSFLSYSFGAILLLCGIIFLLNSLVIYLREEEHETIESPE
ncbi:MAG: APC family permease [Promethearchaeota archaeon]